MGHVHGITLTTITLSAPDAAVLARFYQRLLGWTIGVEEPGWVTLLPPAGGIKLAFQTEEHYVRPVWPAGPGDPPMMAHLEIRVDDLEGAVRHAVAAGATVADHQPQPDVRVCFDPAGHPFCLWTAQ